MWWLNMEVTSSPVRVIPHCQLGCNSLTSNQFRLSGVDSDTHPEATYPAKDRRMMDQYQGAE